MSDVWRGSERTVNWHDPCTPERNKVAEYSVTNGRYRITRMDFSKWWLLDGLQEERKENGNLNQVWFPSLEEAKAAADADNQKGTSHDPH